jgi:hypothetical protein
MFQIAVKLIAVIGVTLLTEACTASGMLVSVNEMNAIPPTAMAQVAANMSTRPDPHEGVVKISGPPVFDRHRTPPTIYGVYSTIDPKSPGTDDAFHIGIVGLFPKRVFLKEVFAAGRPLKTRVHDRERMDCGYGCAVVETLIVAISEPDLEVWAVTGLSFKVSGRRTSFTMFIPAAYFRAVLDRHRAARQELQG